MESEIVYVPCTRTDLRNLPKTFHNFLQNPAEFTKELNWIVRTFDPGHSDGQLIQLIYMPGSRNKTMELLNKICWKIPIKVYVFIVENQVTLRNVSENWNGI